MFGDADYTIPQGPHCLKGPIAHPAPGQLPVRGDLAHIALAGTHLAAHYVIPQLGTVCAAGTAMLLMPSDDSETVTQLDANTAVEILDTAGDWVWICLGADGPAGYCRKNALAD